MVSPSPGPHHLFLCRAGQDGRPRAPVALDLKTAVSALAGVALWCECRPVPDPRVWSPGRSLWGAAGWGHVEPACVFPLASLPTSSPSSPQSELAGSAVKRADQCPAPFAVAPRLWVPQRGTVLAGGWDGGVGGESQAVSQVHRACVWVDGAFCSFFGPNAIPQLWAEHPLLLLDSVSF